MDSRLWKPRQVKYAFFIQQSSLIVFPITVYRDEITTNDEKRFDYPQSAGAGDGEREEKGNDKNEK